MTRRRLVTGTLALVVAVIVGFAVAAGSRDDDEDTAASSAAIGSNGTGKGDASKAPAPEKSGRVTNGKSSEVIKHPDGTGKGGLPGLAKTKHAHSTYLVTRPLPKTASKRGSVVPGFPLAVVPVVPGSAVKSSGVSSTSTRVQLSMLATSKLSPDRILAFYRGKLAARGFEESTVPSVGGSTAAGFAHHGDNLVITVRKARSKGSTTYSVFGTLHAGKSR